MKFLTQNYLTQQKLTDRRWDQMKNNRWRTQTYKAQDILTYAQTTFVEQFSSNNQPLNVNEIGEYFAPDDWTSISNDHEIRAAPFTLHEINEAIHPRRLNKAPGRDSLSFKFYKKHSQQVSQVLLQICNNLRAYFMEDERISSHPEDTLMGLIKLYPKKDANLRSLSNWRSITLFNTV